MKTSTQFFSWRKAIKQSDLPSSTRLVLFIIADYANAMNDVLWPSLERIASDAGLSVRCVTDHIRVAEREGWLTSWLTRRGGRRWAHSCYRLSVPKDVAERFRAALDFELAEECAEKETLDGKKPRRPSFFSSDDAGEMSSFADEGEMKASGAAMDAQSCDESAQGEPVEANRWKNLPTNIPVNRTTKNLSPKQPKAVNEGKGDDERDFALRDSELSNWMLDHLRNAHPSFGEPDLDRWTSTIRGMRVDDGRSYEQMVVLFRWAVRDGFWRKVILSPEKLRSNWGSLVIRREAEKAKEKAKAAASAGAPAAAPVVADDRQCGHVENGCRCTNIATILVGSGETRRGYCRAHIGYYED